MSESKLKINEYYRDTEKAVILLHIPKTGGTTFQAIVRKQFKPEEVLNVAPSRSKQHLEEIKILPDEVKKEKRLFRGHMAFGLHRFLPQQSVYITMLRHPVERTISQYYHALRNATHHLHHEIVSKNIGLKEYILSGKELMLENGQTRHLSSTNRIFFPEREMDLDKIKSVDLLEEAKRNIECHFAFVGITERFDESLALLKHTFGWDVSTDYSMMNVNPEKKGDYRDNHSQEVIEIIENLCDLDMALYEYATKRFDDCLKAFK